MLHLCYVEGPKKTGSVETRLEAMEQQVFKCQGMMERGLNANHMMITEFTNKHGIHDNDIGKHLSRLYDRIDQLQAQIYDLQNQNCPKYDPLSLMSPLMRNWMEPLVEKSDKYDYDYGRGVGTGEKIAQEQAEKNKKIKYKKSTDSGRKKENNTSEASASQKPVMDRIWHDLKEIRKDMLRLPELCARRMIEKMNKTGVFYRTDCDKEFVYHSDTDDYRTPSHSKMNKEKDDDGGHENSHAKVPYYCTPEYLDSFKGDRSDPIEVPDISYEKAVTSLETNEISSHGSGHSNGVDEQVEKVLGKRKRSASKAVKYPFVVVKPIKRAKRSAKAKLSNK
ncbi:sentrin-specific protease 2 [Hordeum vulgare]|nr:sentrin-specific protease 2 [Hordeum vulgare]